MSKDLSNDGPIGSGNDAADAFLNKWKSDANQPSDTGEDTTKKRPKNTPEPDDEDEDTSEETLEDDLDDEDEDEDDLEGDDEDDEDDDGSDPDDSTKKTVAGDEAEVELTVDGKVVKTTVKDLKRLYGQEAVLTRKSQEVAEFRKNAQEAGTLHVTGLTTLLERAREAYKPYAEIDFNLAAKTLDPEEYIALRDDAQKRYDDIKYLETELTGSLETANKQRVSMLQAEAKETLKVLTDPEKGIKGFDQKMYDEMRAFAVNMGIPAPIVNDLVSAPILKLLHKAMLYDKGQKAATVTKDKKAKKIVKTSQSANSSRVAHDPAKKALNKLRNSGSVDDAAEAMLAGWKK